jgi:Protein of unknown function (DUF1353)
MIILFVTPLFVEHVSDAVDMLHEPFMATADDVLITVPKGFASDYASVPKLPVLFEVLGGIGKLAALLHDFLYSSVCAPGLRLLGRAWADDVFYYALLEQGIARWKAWLMWMAVRSAGWAFFQILTATEPALQPALAGSVAAGASVPDGVEVKEP